MRKLFETVSDCFRHGRDFDITVADSQRIKGYKRVVDLGK
jgi:hypothetical protein